MKKYTKENSSQLHILEYENLKNIKEKSDYLISMDNVGLLDVTEKLGNHIMSMYEYKLSLDQIFKEKDKVKERERSNRKKN